MSTQLFIGIAINFICFGLMAWRNPKSEMTVPNFMNGDFYNIFLTASYYLSFAIILLSPEKLLLKIIVALLMQFLINHIIWAIPIGIISGMKVRKIKRKIQNDLK